MSLCRVNKKTPFHFSLVTFKPIKELMKRLDKKKTVSASKNRELLEILKKLISHHYFHKPKFALDIYMLINSRFKNVFSPLELQNALLKLTNKSIHPEYALQEDVDNMRTTYRHVHIKNTPFINNKIQDHLFSQ